MGSISGSVVVYVCFVLCIIINENFWLVEFVIWCEWEEYGIFSWRVIVRFFGDGCEIFYYGIGLLIVKDWIFVCEDE